MPVDELCINGGLPVNLFDQVEVGLYDVVVQEAVDGADICSCSVGAELFAQAIGGDIGVRNDAEAGVRVELG